MGSFICRNPTYPAGTVNAQRPDWTAAITFSSVVDALWVLTSPNWNPFRLAMSLTLAQSRWARRSPKDSAHDPGSADGVTPGVASGPEQVIATSSGPPVPLDPPHPVRTSATDAAATDNASLEPASFMPYKRGEPPPGIGAAGRETRR